MFGASCMAMVLMVVPLYFLNAFIAAKDTICHLKLLVVGDAEMVTLERMSTIYRTRRYVFQPFCPIVCSSAFFSGQCDIACVFCAGLCVQEMSQAKVAV